MCGILFPVLRGEQEGDIQVSELEKSIRCGGCGDGICRSDRSVVVSVSARGVCHLSDSGVMMCFLSCGKILNITFL